MGEAGRRGDMKGAGVVKGVDVVGGAGLMNGQMLWKQVS